MVALAITGLQAQSVLYIDQTTGTQNSYAISSVRKLTFPSGDSLSVNEKSGTILKYALSNVRNINFAKSTEISQTTTQKDEWVLFPNPVISEFQISYKAEVAEVLQLDIVNIQGKVVLQQTLNGQSGSNLFTIAVTDLKQGIYVCRIQGIHKTENLKFIKQ